MSWGNPLGQEPDISPSASVWQIGVPLQSCPND